MPPRFTCFRFLFVLCLYFCSALPSAAQTPTPTPTDEFTIIALPDTQFYSSTYPQIFAAQTQWIAGHVQDQNIKLVLGLGDIVDGRGVLTQWQHGDSAARL